MKYKAHLIGGLLAGAAVLHYSGQTAYSMDGITMLLSASFGALLPDIDHRGSYLGHRTKPLSGLINKIVGHRGATHAPILISILFVTLHLLINVHQMLFIGLLTGALSHVFLDAMTVSGVPLLYPFTRRKVSLGKIKTGGVGEGFVSSLMLILFIFLVFPK